MKKVTKHHARKAGLKTYGAKSSMVEDGANSADEGVTVQASSPEDARKQFTEQFNPLGITIDAVVNEDTGEETVFTKQAAAAGK